MERERKDTAPSEGEGEFIALDGGEGEVVDLVGAFPNVVILIENASIDHLAHELHDIMDGRRENLNHPYHLLRHKVNYKQITYNSETSQYTVYQNKSASTTPEESPLASVPAQIASTSATEGSSDAAQAQNASAVAADPSGAVVQRQNALPTSRYDTNTESKIFSTVL